ncbi:type 2 isopentenyl-diphosphate Delta-isomerase [Rhizobium sp. NTR19]|uniref:Isopentenyl-diphosphate delta-isomerase n=1 Tax=Neorhizobium turbinariae TaxID=2937795 RepID=A0ABT0ILR3_9HYPH|nr:type 2 isopentenyl-diphosphate Delta-isomerase [Neorhizobium turbinariae]MCK8778807.1 type 2 isopentenyl-diphosphate Delta-isomerase [Neorhizobium turbinariae]
MLLERKKQHLDIVLSGKAHGVGRASGFDAIRFEHVALPELDLDHIDLATEFLGKVIKVPFMVSSMTGGPVEALTINHNLAIACEDLRIPLAVGSQRVAIEGDDRGGLGKELRQLAPSTPILANIGAAQLNTGFGHAEAQRAVDMFEADALIIHLNPLQEAVQPEGDRNWSGLLNKIGELCRSLPVPVVVKEVGYGISPKVAQRLVAEGVAVIDVAGAGGTSWTTIEAERAATAAQAAIASAFADWGQPTSRLVEAVRSACPDAGIIASGGISNGVDAAKAIRLGADVVAQAAPVLRAALISPEAVIEHFSIMSEQLRIACFCTGSANLTALRSARLEDQAQGYFSTQ